MTKQEFQELLDRYTTGRVSVSERKLVEDFYARYQKTEAGWIAFSNEKKTTLKHDIFLNILKKKNHTDKSRKYPVIKTLWRVAASVAILTGIGFFMLHQHPTPKNIQYITKTTGKGQKATLKLSDGSVVRLNAESSVSYPEVFSESRREISLQGEAFFEVMKDKNRPFIVSSYDIQTTVLGTSFDLNAYDSADISVALVAGKVKVEDSHQNTVYLTPGKMAQYDHLTERFNIDAFDYKKMTAWKDGIIYLSEASYTQVFGQLAQWYGVEFQFENSCAEDWAYSGEFKDMSLELILNTIAYSKGFDFKIRKDLVTIKFENTNRSL